MQNAEVRIWLSGKPAPVPIEVKLASPAPEMESRALPVGIDLGSAVWVRALRSLGLHPSLFLEALGGELERPTVLCDGADDVLRSAVGDLRLDL